MLAVREVSIEGGWRMFVVGKLEVDGNFIVGKSCRQNNASLTINLLILTGPQFS
jgi:hypothetical protein